MPGRLFKHPLDLFPESSDAAISTAPSNTEQDGEILVGGFISTHLNPFNQTSLPDLRSRGRDGSGPRKATCVLFLWQKLSQVRPRLSYCKVDGLTFVVQAKHFGSTRTQPYW